MDCHDHDRSSDAGTPARLGRAPASACLTSAAAERHRGGILGVGRVLALPHGQLVLRDRVRDVGDDLLDDVAIGQAQRVELRVCTPVAGRREPEERAAVSASPAAMAGPSTGQANGP
jgi:hypothetical protein